MVSHELRGPLTSIKGSAATVLGSSTDMEPAVVRQFFRIIEEQADHMHDLVADLLDVARIETGTLPVAPEPAEVAALVDRARSAFISCRGQEQPRHRDRTRPAPGHGGPAAHRAGPGQPPVQRRPALLGVVRHHGDRRAGGRLRCGLGGRRRQGHTLRAAALPVSEVHPYRGGRTRKRCPRVGPGSRHLQGDSGGARWPHLGGERGSGHGSAVHLHASVRRGVR